MKPNDFRGWCQKLRDVGANRLICVSAKPFPRSIRDKVAKELGPTVLLVRLEALEAKQWPFQIVNNAMKVYKSKVEVDSTIRPNPLLVFHPDQNPFQEYIGESFSAASLPNVIRREGHAELLPLMDLVNEGVRLMNKHPELIRLPEGVRQVPDATGIRKVSRFVSTGGLLRYRKSESSTQSKPNPSFFLLKSRHTPKKDTTH